MYSATFFSTQTPSPLLIPPIQRDIDARGLQTLKKIIPDTGGIGDKNCKILMANPDNGQWSARGRDQRIQS